MSTTFSQMIDSMLLELRRPDLLSDATSYLNQTLRELHFEPTKGNSVYYRDNRKELQLSANSDTGFGWSIPIRQPSKDSVLHGLIHSLMRMGNPYGRSR